MSDQYPTSPAPEPAGQPAPAYAAAATVQRERMGLGLLGALVAVVLGVAVTVAIWKAGYIAGLASFAMAAGAAFLYTKAAGAPPRKGLAPLIALIIAGVGISFFACVASDLIDAYRDFGLASSGVSRNQFVRDNLFNGEVLGTYGKDIAIFVGFAALGVFGTIRSLIAANRR